MCNATAPCKSRYGLAIVDTGQRMWEGYEESQRKRQIWQQPQGSMSIYFFVQKDDPITNVREILCKDINENAILIFIYDNRKYSVLQCNVVKD